MRVSELIKNLKNGKKVLIDLVDKEGQIYMLDVLKVSSTIYVVNKKGIVNRNNLSQFDNLEIAAYEIFQYGDRMKKFNIKMFCADIKVMR